MEGVNLLGILFTDFMQKCLSTANWFGSEGEVNHYPCAVMLQAIY